jgi:hypothetical protein
MCQKWHLMITNAHKDLLLLGASECEREKKAKIKLNTFALLVFAQQIHLKAIVIDNHRRHLFASATIDSPRSIVA